MDEQSATATDRPTNRFFACSDETRYGLFMSSGLPPRIGSLLTAASAPSVTLWAAKAPARLLKLRLASVAVSLIVHAPLVWWLSERQPVPIPVTAGLNSLAAIESPAVAAAAESHTTEEPFEITKPVRDLTEVDRPQDPDQPAPELIDVHELLTPVEVLEADVEVTEPPPARNWLEQMRLIDSHQPPAINPSLKGDLSVIWTPQADETKQPPRTGTVDPGAEDNPRAAAVEPEQTPAPPADQPVPNAAESVSRPRQDQPDLTTESRDEKRPSPAPQSASKASVAQAGADVDVLPQRLPTNPRPPYPDDAWLARIEGRVILRVLVSENGTVTRASLLRSSGHTSLDQSALTTVRNWKFLPAERNGRRVSYEIGVPVTFRFRDR